MTLFYMNEVYKNTALDILKKIRYFFAAEK